MSEINERDLAVDLATAVARLEQLMRLGIGDVLTGGVEYCVWHRILDCDVPRLREWIRQLDPKILAFLEEVST